MAQGSLIKRKRASEQLSGFVIVAISMVGMYLVPREYFVYAVFVSTTAMIVVSIGLTRYTKLFQKPSWKSIGTGLVTAAILYVIFFAGNYGITVVHPLGITTSSETSIYSEISSHPIALQLGILAFDAVGFESYFRGNLQSYFLAQKGSGSKFGVAAVFASAAIDALIHLASLNPLWVITTFIVDSIWGLTYYYTKDLASSITSHFVWDIFIFIIAPIK